MPAIVLVTRAPVDWAIAIFSLAFFGQQSWSTLVMILPTDLFDRRVVASVAGLVGFGGAIGGLLMNLAAGRLLDAGFGYGAVFNIVGTLHVIGFAVILIAIPRIQPAGDGPGSLTHEWAVDGARDAQPYGVTGACGRAGTRPSPGRCEPAGRRRPAPGGSRSCPRSPGTARAP